MSEPADEQNPAQVDQSAGQNPEATAPPQETPTTAAAAPPPQADTGAVTEVPLRLVKRPTGETHWNTAAGIWEVVTHAETGEPSQEYVLLATIDGQEVALETYNAGRLETVARSLNQAQQSSEG